MGARAPTPSFASTGTPHPRCKARWHLDEQGCRGPRIGEPRSRCLIHYSRGASRLLTSEIRGTVTAEFSAHHHTVQHGQQLAARRRYDRGQESDPCALRTCRMSMTCSARSSASIPPLRPSCGAERFEQPEVLGLQRAVAVGQIETDQHAGRQGGQRPAVIG